MPSSDDLAVDAGRDDAVDGERLRDVLEAPLAERLQHERALDALRGHRAHHDVAALRGAGEARRDVGGGAGRGERPALRRRPAQLGGARPAPGRY